MHWKQPHPRFEIAHLHGSVMPVAMDQTMLIAQHFQHRPVLFFGELIRITDAQLRLSGFNEQRSVRNVDRAIISLNAAFIALAVRQILLNKTTCQLSGGVGKVLVLYINRFGPHW